MACQTIANIEIAGISSAVPYESRELEDEYTSMNEEFVDRVSQATGVVKRHISPKHLCSSDLACAATSKLLEELNWDKKSLDCIVLITQTPDYLIPNTSSILHKRLGLDTKTVVFDVSMGCSGYVYGLWMVGNLLQSGGLKRGLVIVADTVSKLIAPTDHSYQLLFGDAACVTALEFNENATDMFFNLGSDGSGFDSLIIPKGLFRDYATNTDITPEKMTQFAHKPTDKLNMDGADIMNFALNEIPRVTDELLTYANKDKTSINYWIMHQANKIILTYLAKKIEIPLNKMLFSLEDFGNTSSASIPLTLSYRLNKVLSKEKSTLMLSAFGVGLSWGSALINCAPMVVPEIIYLK
jgi:3-oxoacyl-[acyl-carrier-protein] synthase-3